MKLRKTTYLVHRWLALVVCLQLLAWSAGGFMFSILHIESVRGETEIGQPPFAPLSELALDDLVPPLLPPLIERDVTEGTSIGSVAIVDRGLGPRWEFRDTHGRVIASKPFNGEGNETLISSDQACQVALRDFAPSATVASVQLIERDPPIEFRNGVLPAYQVILDHPKNPHFYVDARTGEITARRNDKWRIFDFFWMLHTMDYNGRDDFNHLLLTVFSILAIATSASGISLWVWRASSRVRRWRLRARART